MSFIIIGNFDELKTRISADWVRRYSIKFSNDEEGEIKKFWGADTISFENLRTEHYDKIIVGASFRNRAFVKRLVEQYDVPFEKIWSLDRFEYYLIAEHNELPVRVGIDASTLCQLNCRTCYMRLSNYGILGAGYLKISDFAKFIDNNPSIISVEISNNGEPLLNPDIIDIIKYAYDKGIYLTANNGVNFNTVADNVLEALVKYRFHSIKIAIDGATNDTYSLYRQKGDIHKVFSNIEKLIKYKEKYASKYPILIWQYILMDHNESEIELALNKAAGYGMNIDFKISWDGFHPADVTKAEQLTGISLSSKTTNEYNLPKMKICKQLFACPQINWDGRLLGCCYVYKSDFGVNAFNNTLDDILNSEEFLLSRRMAMGDFSIKLGKTNPCKKCSVMKENKRSGVGISGEYVKCSMKKK